MNLQPNENNEVICRFEEEHKVGEKLVGLIAAFGEVKEVTLLIGRASSYEEWYNYTRSIGDAKKMTDRPGHFYYAIYLD